MNFHLHDFKMSVAGSCGYQTSMNQTAKGLVQSGNHSLFNATYFLFELGVPGYCIMIFFTTRAKRRSVVREILGSASPVYILSEW
jgi:phosphotransferase system  glucose/maltose/N-acetylglucosamine-specific IIC component